MQDPRHTTPPVMTDAGRRAVTTERFVGEIFGAGTREGTRIVVGSWTRSPYGAFADVMIERPDGHRLLLAPAHPIAEYVAGTYTFDEVRVVPVVVQQHGERFRVSAGPLNVAARIGRRTMIGWALHLLPEPVTAQPWFSRICDPIARIVLPGVRTRGTAGGERFEFYGAHDVHAVTSLSASWAGCALGGLAPVEPPPRFGFGSTPRHPALTRLTTTVVSGATPGARVGGRVARFVHVRKGYRAGCVRGEPCEGGVDR